MTKTLKITDLITDQLLHYTGKYFLGFDESDREMKFIEPDQNSVYGIWVYYNGNKMVVDIFDVAKPIRLIKQSER